MQSNFRHEETLELDLQTDLHFIPHRAPLKRQTSNSRSPCPASSGTAAGTTQQFNLLCGSDLPSDDLVQRPATSLLQCIDICSSWHPRCYAVAYEASAAHGQDNCYLKYTLGSPTTQPYEMDAATAIWPSTQDDCSVNGTVIAGGYNFQTFCGLDYPRDDTAQRFADSLQECLGLCAGQSGCFGVSYEASMANGFENCYLKSSASAAGLYKQQYVIDSAFRLGPASSATTSSTIPSLSSSSDTPVGSVSSTTARLLSSSTAPVGAASNSTTPLGNSTQHSSMAWVAGAVIGPIALITLVAGLALLLYRRKRPRTTSQLGNRELSAEAPGLPQTQDKAPVKPVTELDGRPVRPV